MTGPLLVLALAAAPEILLPPWSLSTDGDFVAVRGDAPLAADQATVERVAPGLFHVVPAPRAREVRFSAGGASAVAPVAELPGEIAISIRPAAPVKGRDATVELEIAVRRASGAPDPEASPPDIVASSGRVGDLVPAGQGAYRASYFPARTRHPEVAVLLALAPNCPLCPTPRAVGYAIIPLAAAIDLPGRSEPGARTTVVVGGRTFGPAVADAGGHFSIPVVVAPGAHVAEATAVDSLGNQRETEVDLRLPPVDRLACAAWPRVLPSAPRSAADVWCVASTAGGAPAPQARLTISASTGEIGKLQPFQGALQRARYRPPARVDGGEAILAAAYPEGGPASTDEIRIALATGAPAEIEAEVARAPVPPGAASPAETAVRDADGDVLGAPSGPPGAIEGFVAPDRFVARALPGDLVQEAALSFALAPGREAATVSLRREGGTWLAEARTVDARPAEGVTLRFGSGATATTDARGEARVPARGPIESVVAASGARAAGWTGIVPPPAPFEIARTVRVPLRPPFPVDVTARLEHGMLRWRVEDAQGHPLPARPVHLRASGVELGPPEPDGEGGRAAVRGGRGMVAVVDAETGVAAVVEVP